MSEIELNKLKEKIRNDRKERFSQSFPFFGDFDKSRRDFAFKIATIAATIGAFSFLISDRVPSPEFLSIGDGFILFTIIFAAATYIIQLQKDYKIFHKTYFDLFERDNEQIDNIDKILIQDKTPNTDYFIEQYNKIPPYERPKSVSYFWLWVNLVLLFVSLIFIVLSFFKKI